MIALKRTDFPVPAEPVKKKFSPLRIRSRMSDCCVERGRSDGAGGVVGLGERSLTFIT